MTNYELVPIFERATIKNYLELFELCFGADKKFTEEYLDWQYTQNPDGQVIGFDAYFENALVGHYAIIPRCYQHAGKYFIAALSLNTATHPGHQGRGLFVKLAQATYIKAKELGVQFVVGAANANSIGGFTRRLGFTELGHIRLQLGWRAPERPDTALDLQGNSEWLTWRFSNPARRYARIEHGDGTSTVQTWVRNIPFNICRVSTDKLRKLDIINLIPTKMSLMPGLSPVFGLAKNCNFYLPKKIQPSPWHVIWRSLSTECDAELALNLWFDGRSMDTF